MGTITRVVDDYTGKELPEGEGTKVRISLNDDWWEMDLSSDSLAKLEKALAPFTDKALSIDAPQPELPARRGRGPARATTRTKVTGDSPDYRAAVRAWANANGMPTGDRGRIKQEIYDAYEKAHGTA